MCRWKYMRGPMKTYVWKIAYIILMDAHIRCMGGRWTGVGKIGFWLWLSCCKRITAEIVGNLAKRTGYDTGFVDKRVYSGSGGFRSAGACGRSLYSAYIE